MMYDNYHVDETVENLVEFISRYRSNRLVNTNKARVIITKDMYEEWFAENAVIKSNAKVTTELICNDFLEWYKNKYPEKVYLSHIKLETGAWSTAFKKEITSTISNITKLEYKERFSFTDRKRGIHFPNCAGFSGFELQSMNKKIEFFDKSIYELYVKEFMTITDNPRHKVARAEIIDDFLLWIKDNNYTTKNRIFCRTAISSIFRDDLIENLGNILDKKIEDVCKLTFNGCFVGVIHKNFLDIGNESSPRQLVSDEVSIKTQIDKWLKCDSIIANIFKLALKNKKISIREVRNIMDNSYSDLTLNKKKRKWYLVFEKDDDENYILTKNALEYCSSLNC